MEVDWSHIPQANRQHYTSSLNVKPRGDMKRGRPRNIRGAAICNQTSKKLDTTGEE